MASRNTRSSTKRKTENSAPQSTTSASAADTKRPKQGTSKEINPTSISKVESKSISEPDEALKIEEETGDIFAAAANTLIIHACNCQGSWGAGIAKAFKDRYPKAYMEHVYHCEEQGDALLDSAQLIPPVDSTNLERKDDAGRPDQGFEMRSSRENDDGDSNSGNPKHFVGCLFTSRHYGRKKDSPSRILAATKPAMLDLLQQIQEWNRKAEESEKVGEVRMCQINSGMFAVPWQKTKNILESIDVSDNDVKIIKVISPPS